MKKQKHYWIKALTSLTEKMSFCLAYTHFQTQNFKSFRKEKVVQRCVSTTLISIISAKSAGEVTKLIPPRNILF